MKKITVIAGDNGTEKVCVKRTVTETQNGKTVTKTVNYYIPVGDEVTVDDDVYSAAISQYDCIVGYFVNDAEDVAGLPTSGIKDGSYAFIMSTKAVKFLSEGSWQ